jgi:hypothetical protein
MSRCSRSPSMRRLCLLFFACMFLVALGHAPNTYALVRVSVGINYSLGSYDLLSEYGQWLRVAPFGVVWCPFVDESWAPFSDGRWISTSYGWAWDSYEPFGALVYHYGYWYYENDIGWFWVPGDEWSPARVQWIVYGSYCGWAPLPPPHYYWPNPWDVWRHNIWIVVYVGNFCDDHIGHYGIDPGRYRTVMQRDHVAKRAPDVKQVETATKRRVPIQTIERRPMDIRTDKIEVAERSTVRRNAPTGEVSRAVPAIIKERAAVESQRSVITPVENAKMKREPAVPTNRGSATTATRSPVVERKAPTPAKSVQPSKPHAAGGGSPERVVKTVKRSSSK